MAKFRPSSFGLSKNVPIPKPSPPVVLSNAPLNRITTRKPAAQGMPSFAPAPAAQSPPSPLSVPTLVPPSKRRRQSRKATNPGNKLGTGMSNGMGM